MIFREQHLRIYVPRTDNKCCWIFQKFNRIKSKSKKSVLCLNRKVMLKRIPINIALKMFDACGLQYCYMGRICGMSLKNIILKLEEMLNRTSKFTVLLAFIGSE